MTLSLLQAFFFDYGYYAVFGVLVLCGMGLPLPEDITLIAAGIISQLGEQNVHVMLVVAYFGVLCGDWMMYLIGWRFGPHLRQSRWFSKLLTPERMIQTETLFHRYGSRLVFFARFLPGLRAPIYVMTGITRRVSFWRFTLMDGLAALLSIPLFVYIGYYGAENHEWMLKKMHEFKYATIALFLVIAGVIAQHRFIVAVPAHAFIAIVVEVEQAGVVMAAADAFNRRFQRAQRVIPRTGAVVAAGIAVIEGAVAIPGDFARGGHGLAVNQQTVVLPGNLRQ